MENMDSTSFSVVESKRARPAVLRELIATVFRNNNDETYRKCRPYLMPPGRDGSTQFDHCEVVNIILEADGKTGGHIATYMIANDMSKVQLWKAIERTLRWAGYEMTRGRVAGVLEQNPEQSEPATQLEAIA